MFYLSDREVLKILDGPTALESLGVRPNSVFIKRDDTLIQGIGGNKARKLEFVLGELRKNGISEITTFGAWGSNHLLTTALCASRFGFKMTAYLSPQPVTDDVKKKLLVLKKLNVNLISCSSAVSLGLEILKKKNVRGFIEPGASSALGALGYVKAAFELVEQLKEKKLEQKKIQVFAPVGSAGTVAGLLAGFALAGFSERTEVIGVQTVPMHWNFGTIGILRLTAKVIRLCEPNRAKQKDLMKKVRKMWVWSAFDYRPGYGKADQEVHDTIAAVSKKDGIHLDATYSGKAMHRLLKQIQNAPEKSGEIQIFWNTYPKYPLDELSNGQDWSALPPEFHFIFK